MNKIKLETEIYFGKGSINDLSNKLKSLNVKKIMITYGGGSIKRNGIFEQVINQLKKANIEYIEFGGIKPNPRHTTIDKAAKIANEENVNLILAIGGGSTIDASKVIAAKATNKWNTCWDFVKGETSLENTPLPLGAIITLSGTASENNGGSVVTNEETKEKYSCFTKAPIFAIEDPLYTFTVNKWQTASGSFDSFSHLLEQFFGPEEFDFTDNMIIGMLKTIIKNAPIAIDDPTNYKARESLMISSSFALNGVLKFKEGGDWFVHQLEHALSAVWDITHGAGLATISYHYYDKAIKISDKYRSRAELLARELFNKSTAEDFVEELRLFIEKLSLPIKLKDYEIIDKVTKEEIDKLIKHVKHRGALALSDNNISELIEKMI